MVMEEYKISVEPVMLDRSGLFRIARRQSLFDTECRLWRAAEKVELALRKLKKLGFTGKNPIQGKMRPGGLGRAQGAPLQSGGRREQSGARFGKRALRRFKQLNPRRALHILLTWNNNRCWDEGV
jgi:hypothetical protein